MSPLVTALPSKPQSPLRQEHVHVPFMHAHPRAHHVHTPILYGHVLLFFMESSIYVQFRRDWVTHRCAPTSCRPCQVETQPHLEPCLVHLVSPAENVMEGTGLWPRPGDPILRATGRCRGPHSAPGGSACVQKALGSVD